MKYQGLVATGPRPVYGVKTNTAVIGETLFCGNPACRDHKKKISTTSPEFWRDRASWIKGK